MTADDLRPVRLERLRARMTRDGYDWLVAGAPENVRYATGYGSVMGELARTAPLAALVSADAVWLVGPCADSAPAIEQGFPADRYVPFGRFFFESPDGRAAPTQMADRHATLDDAFATALRSAAVRGTVALDAATPAGARELLGGLADVERVVDADRWTRQVRARKAPGEVERLRTAAELAEAGIGAALAAAKPGSSERELARVVATTMAEGGGIPRFLVVTAGVRSALADTRPTDNVWEPGQLLRFDVGCVFEGYWSDVGRTAVLGAPDALQQRRYAAILAGEERELEAVRPGIRASELFDIAVETVEAEGLAPYRRHHCGHGIGMEIYEPPIVAPGWDDPLEPEMTFCLETPFYELGWGGMMVEDAIVVTDDGHERLTRSDRDLRVVDA